MLQIENIHKSFDHFKAVNGATLHVEKGEIVAVIGPNGAGKTTLFNLISGQLKPDSGEVRFHEEVISKLSAHQICRKGIARSFQIANIFPRLSVFKNVQVAVLARQNKSFHLFRPAQMMAVEETTRILDSVGLLHRAKSLAGTLSHGDRRILEIAIALGSKPELLILDEPTAGMSPDETTKAMNLIRELADSHGLTILFCEHDMEIVFNIAQRIMVMHQGRTLIQGTPQEVRGHKEVREAYLGGTERC
jgi:branched-chain amino acid transport system ATP-binding protein